MKVLLLISIYLILYSSAIAKPDTLNWEYMGGVGGGYCQSLNIDGNGNLYFMSMVDIYKSTDKGESWQPFFYGKGQMKLRFDSANYPYLLTSSYNKYIFYSTNDGKKWDTLFIPKTYPETHFLDFYISPHNRFYAFLNIEENQNINKIIYFTDDFGKKWDSISVPLSFEFNYDHISIDTGGTIAIWKYNNGKTNLLIRKPWDTTWKSLFYNDPFSYFYFITESDYYASFGSKGLYLLTNSGENWDYIGISGISKNDIYYKNYNEIYVTTRSGLTYTTNGGKTWINDNDKFKELIYPEYYYGGVNIDVINGDNEGNLYVTIGTVGVFKSTDCGNSWVEKNIGLECAYSRGVTFDNQNNLLISTDGIFKSYNNGKTWNYTGYRNYRIQALFKSRKGYLLGSSVGGILKSTDNGDSWFITKKELATDTETVLGIELFIEQDAGKLIGKAKNYSALISSTDEGFTWKYMYLNEVATEMALNNEDILFLGGLLGDIFKSEDNGISWKKINEGQGDDISGFSIIIFHPRAPTGYSFNSSDRYITRDNGNNWTHVDGWSDNPPKASIVFLDSTYKYCFFIRGYNFDGKIVRSDPYFQNYDTLICKGFMHYNFSSILAGPDGHYYAFAYWGGVYRTKEKFVSVPNPHTQNANLSLSVFPNPISSEAEIIYSLPEPSWAKLQLYNSLGICISTLFDGYCDSGAKTIRFQTEDLPSGLYFCKLESGGGVVTEKVIILK